jgi:hypothetical protein
MNAMKDEQDTVMEKMKQNQAEILIVNRTMTDQLRTLITDAKQTSTNIELHEISINRLIEQAIIIE